LARVLPGIFEGSQRKKEMIKPLRKYHYWFWRLMAIVLPIVFALALLLRPLSRVQAIESSDFYFRLTTSNGKCIVSIQLLNPLRAPSCVVYATANTGEKIILGTINSIGNYTFTSSLRIESVSLFDAINKKEIASHRFTNE